MTLIGTDAACSVFSLIAVSPARRIAVWIEDASRSFGNLITTFAFPSLERLGTRHARDRGSNMNADDWLSLGISSVIVENEDDASASVVSESFGVAIILSPDSIESEASADVSLMVTMSSISVMVIVSIVFVFRLLCFGSDQLFFFFVFMMLFILASCVRPDRLPSSEVW